MEKNGFREATEIFLLWVGSTDEQHRCHPEALGKSESQASGILTRFPGKLWTCLKTVTWTIEAGARSVWMADRWTKNEKSLQWNEGSTSINLGHEQILVSSYFPSRINPLSFLSYCYGMYFVCVCVLLTALCYLHLCLPSSSPPPIPPLIFKAETYPSWHLLNQIFKKWLDWTI